ncbi:MAG: helix-turn-helix transcriptional regulator [Verrucomicrobiota bacterium]
MERLSHADYARLLDFIALLQEPVALEEFGAMIVRSTTELVPGATIAFDQIDERSGLYRGFDHNVPLDLAEQARMHARLQQVYQENPIYGYIQAGGKGPVVDLDTLMPRRDFQRTDFYQDIFRPYGIRHQVSVLLSRDGWINTLTLNQARPISGKAITLLTLATRHIQLAHRNACHTHQIANACSEIAAIPLTPREVEVFGWLHEGKRNGEIATILGCAKRTVDKHVENILRKTGTETRTAAVRGR